MTAPYVVTDRDGNYVTVNPAAHGVDVTVTDAATRCRATATIPVGRLADLVAALYRHAGQTVPVLINPNEVAEDWVRVTRTGGAA